MRFEAARLLLRPVLSVLLLIVLPSCGEKPPIRPHVVCVLIDQLRNDMAEKWSSRLMKLAQDGVIVEDMRSAAPWTYPSVISLMSGLYPQQHGADGRADHSVSNFDEGVPLIQGILKAEGYRTAAYITNPFLHEWNEFHRDFDLFDASFVRNLGNRLGLPLEFDPGTMFGDSVNRAIVEDFDSVPLDVPEFTYIHYIDVHGPWRDAPFEPDYVSSIRYMDERVVEIYDYFMRRYQGNLLFFVTSDHGLAMVGDRAVGYGPEWRMNKASVHDFNIRVPFWILPSDLVPRSRRVRGATSSVDFVPTLLEWLEIRPQTPLPGISLMPAIRGDGMLPADRAIYARMSAWNNRPNDCVVTEGRKYMRFFDRKDRKLAAKRVFDLRDDPDETHSVSDSFGARARLVNGLSGDHGLSFPAAFRELDAETEKQLRELGYLK